MTPFQRYLLLQAPGWLAVAAALAALHWLTGWPAWIVPAGLALSVAKDLVMYRVYRDTLRAPRPGLLGARGRAVERLAPRGYVRVQGELWRAETTAGPIEAGTEIVVRETRGLTLRVGPAEER
jgi:membrane protein implicated in regulation of membrane protease activity